MNRKHAFLTVAALAFSATPALAQAHEHGQQPAAEHAAMGANAMICTMGMLPHAGMGGGMMGEKMGEKMGQKMGQKMGEKMGQMSGMQHGQPAQAGAAKAAEAKAAEHGEDMSHPVTPTMLIHHATDLALTPDQIAKVTELLTASAASCNAHLEAATHSHHQAAMLLGGPTASPDLAAYEARLKEAVTHVLQGHVAVVKAGVEAKKLLTPAQLEKLGKHE